LEKPDAKSDEFFWFVIGQQVILYQMGDANWTKYCVPGTFERINKKKAETKTRQIEQCHI
jgi:hypothetical protein